MERGDSGESEGAEQALRGDVDARVWSDESRRAGKSEGVEVEKYSVPAKHVN